MTIQLRRIAIVCLFIAAAAPTIAARAADGASLLHLRPEGYASVSTPDTAPLPADGWLALACIDGVCRLAPARAWVDREPVSTFDETVGGEVLRGEAPPGTLALLHGIAGLRPGPVATEYANAHFPDLSPPLADDTGAPIDPPPLAWTAGAAARRLTLAIDEASPEACFNGDCVGRWTLEGDGPPIEMAVSGGDPVYGRAGMLAPADALVWVGDLDGDGRLDLLLRPQPRPDYLQLRLLLGRDRPAAGDWPPVAEFYWWDPENPGC